MFYCDRLSHNDHAAIADVLDIPHLIRHRHSVDSFFDDYRQQAGIASAQKLTGLREITPYYYICRPRAKSRTIPMSVNLVEP